MRWLPPMLALAVVSAPQVAEACSICLPATVESPSEAQVQPGNVAVLTNLPLEQIVVTVDGVPASVELVPGVVIDRGPERLHGVRVEPIPTVGTFVEYVNTEQGLCFGEVDPPDPVQFEVGPPDAFAPQFDGQPWFDWHVVDVAQGCLECCEPTLPPRGFVYVRTEILPDPPRNASRFTRVDLSADGVTTFATVTASADDGPNDLQIPWYQDGQPCVRVAVVDYAGNETSTPWMCEPCRTRIDPTSYEGASDVAEPDWTDADRTDQESCGGATPGGTTGGDTDPVDSAPATTADPNSTDNSASGDTDASTPHESGLADRGCGCSTRPPSPTSFVWLTMAAVGWRRRQCSASQRSTAARASSSSSTLS